MESLELPGNFEANAGITFTSGNPDTPETGPRTIPVLGLASKVTIDLVPKEQEPQDTAAVVAGGRRRRRKTKSKKSKSKSKKRAHPRRRTRYQH
jgi:hypothetical protein